MVLVSSFYRYRMMLMVITVTAICATSSDGSMENTGHTRKFWGTYRAYPYIGLRCQSPFSPLFGLMWYQPSSTGNLASVDSVLRHECRHDDQMEKFGWNQHDGQGYGEAQ